MAATHEGRQCQYPCSGYSPEFNSTCMRVYKAYGTCCGPCDSPCYIVSNAHYSPGGPDCKTGNQGI